MDTTPTTTDRPTKAALTALSHPDKDVRQEAAVRLGRAADPADVPALARALWAEPDFFVRETLTWALTRTPQSAAREAVAVLDGTDGDVRLQAVHLLSKIAEPSTVPAVSRLLDDPDPAVVDKAGWALSRVGHPEVVPLLLDRLGPSSLPARDALTRALAHLGAAAVPQLTDALTEGTDAVRAHAAEVLCVIGGPAAVEAVPALARALEDEVADVRLSAVMALRELVADPRATAALRSAAEASGDARVRAVARVSI
ncbi:HEAT repeat domain-containing protein [Ornithinimicrobium pekingense]|uniref:HEAT repeat domain-containing protein n=1 Tax=Ornithinimicrobium pekingense TaxID=384677 RepID=A0ABQ2FA98_9MICO|nr:HEAT repeat domain-containing protein [Ornithinimicrobium pekingense]GGK67928.1 hypothetical protein GCM10011509_15380 [Ornithinimicrobium pekingense]